MKVSFNGFAFLFNIFLGHCELVEEVGGRDGDEKNKKSKGKVTFIAKTFNPLKNH